MAVLTVATVVSLVVLALKVQIFIRQLRERRAALEMDEEVSGIARKLKKHRKKTVKLTKAIQMTYFASGGSMLHPLLYLS